jgi:dephospho-CoA kinase
MLRAGLTGGLATGKSFVAGLFEQWGCFVIRADDLGRQVLAPGGAAETAVLDAFGSEILTEGAIDRRKLAAIVFPDPKKLDRLNQIVHPLVREQEETMFAAAQARNPSGIAIVEAAILIETGSYRRMDCLILTACREDQQIARAMSREGATEADVRARLARQMPLHEKRKYADYIIDTSGSLDDTVAHSHLVFEQLRSRIA